MRNNIKKDLERARLLTNILDTRFNIFGIKFGIDPLLSIVPTLGSVIGSIASAYIFWIALQLSLPKETYMRMLVNILIDFAFGSIPAVGFVLDTFYKSNVRNLKIVENYLSSHPH